MHGVILDSQSLGPGVSLKVIHDCLPSWSIFPSTKESQTFERIRDADIVLSNKVPLRREHFEAFPRLKFISVLATGTNNIDLDAAEEFGISVSNVRAYSTDSVVQHTLALIFSLAGSLPSYSQAVKQGKWQDSPFFCWFDRPIFSLKGMTLVIVGLGSQGKALSQVAETMGLNVKVAARPGKETESKRPSLESLLPEADIISIHCPLTPETENLIGKEELSLMKDSAILINCARGGIINERDLASHLNSGKLGGCALDVLTQEPPPHDHPLLKVNHPNFILTPHIAWGNLQSRESLIKETAMNLRGFINGKPRNLVTRI